MNTQLQEKQLFTTAPVGRAVISLAVPTVIGQLINVIYNMADTFFIGQLGDPNQVAAATLSMPVFIFLTGFANLFGIGGASMISRCLGANKHDVARQCSSFCVWSAVALSFCYGVAVVLARGVLLPILGANADTLGYCAAYVFWTVGVGAVPTVLSAALAHLIRAEGYSKQASFGVAFGGILNMVLDPIFIFVFKLEITGAAIATMLSNVVAVIYLATFVIRRRNVSAITLSPKYFSAGNGVAGEVLSVGLPSFVMTLMSTLSNSALNKMVSAYSNEAVAGMGIAKKIDLIAFAIAQGMTQGTLPLIGYNYSSGDRKRMLSAIRVLLFDCVSVAVVGMAVMFFTAAPITRLFINDALTVEHGRMFLRIVCLACPTTALNFLVITVFQATGKRVQPLVLSFLRKGGLDIPIMLLLNRFVGISGIAWATPLADVLALCVAVVLIIPYLKMLKSACA